MKNKTNGRENPKDSVPLPGAAAWFSPGDEARVEELSGDLKRLGLKRIRVGVSWARWRQEKGRAFYHWLFARLGGLDILPCFSATPPVLGTEATLSSPPRNPADFANFLDEVCEALGKQFAWAEPWDQPNRAAAWDWRLDPGWSIFCEMITLAAERLHRRRKQVALGGMRPLDLEWLEMLCRRGVVCQVDAVALHALPTLSPEGDAPWAETVARVKSMLESYDYHPEVWITDAGYPSAGHDEFAQARALMELLQAPTERLYWRCGRDRVPDFAQDERPGEDERLALCGLRDERGNPKLLLRIWAERGLEGVTELLRDVAPSEQKANVENGHGKVNGNGKPNGNGKSESTHPAKWMVHARARQKPVLITGGAGFIGSNLAQRLLASGQPVLIYDNLSRPGVEENLHWLRRLHGDALQVEVADTRNARALAAAVARTEHVFHFAAQVAVTTSLTDPAHDLEVNLGGTFNLLEAMRRMARPPTLVFTSTNKVYGALEDVHLVERGMRHEPFETRLRESGIDERHPLDFHSPYGCSKGAADQYVIDYARIYGLPAAVFRMSCIYGPRQFGTEDQGWVAHFLIRALERKPITLYGDGKQVRDILYIDDLVDAFLLAQEKIEQVRGQAFNIGGGPDSAISLTELMKMIEQLTGRRPALLRDAWRPGDQKYYVSNTAKFTRATHWRPRVAPLEGVERLARWLAEARGLAPVPSLHKKGTSHALPSPVAKRAGQRPTPLV